MDQTAVIILRCNLKHTRQSPPSPYLDLKVKDDEGNVFYAKRWDATADEQALKAGDVMSIAGKEEEFKGREYVNIQDLTIDTDGAIDKSVFIEKMEPAKKQALVERFEKYKAMVTNIDYMKTIRLIFNQQFCEDEFFIYPAGIQMHHAFVGGLLQHTVEVCDIAYSIYTAIKPYHQEIDLNVIMGGALLHDIGKTQTYTFENGIPQIKDIEYTVGHAIYGIEKIAAVERMIERNLNRLKHVVASHQGKREFDAAKTPTCKEAFIVHHADFISSQFAVFDNLDYSDGKAWFNGAKSYIFKSGDVNVGH